MSSLPVTNGVVTLLPPPEGYIVNFENPQQQKAIDHYVTFGVGGTLATLALVQRFYTKIHLSNGLQIDDGFMFLAWLSSMATQSLNTRGFAIKGLGVHAWEMPIERYEEYTFLLWISSPIYTLCNGFTKLSLLYFYLNLSPQRWWKIACYVVVALVAIYTPIITFLLFLGCNPVSKAWDTSVAGGSCVSFPLLYIATSVSNIVTDILLFLLPIRMIIGLQMGQKQKIGAMVLFGIGSMTVATSVVRLALLIPLLSSPDQPWDTAPGSLWVFIEANLFIICGSMPTLRRFFSHVAPRLMESYGPSTNDRPSGANSKPTRISTLRKSRSDYTKFSDDVELCARSESTTPSAGKSQWSEATVKIEGPNGDGGGDPNGGILRTKTVTVQYA
ncbi:hypothetical protein F4778DRAFT_426695 [Xylariomycetidae sp. FL2044]|nr:hypothetical protein F4778DRAFT_426695 [Xylariomycetidae sp. FL2044]